MPILITKGFGKATATDTDAQLLPTIGYGGISIGEGGETLSNHDCRHLDVVFEFAVNEGDASNPVNYSIPGLIVSAAVKMTDHWYRLTTTRQTMGVTYTLTTHNIGVK